MSDELFPIEAITADSPRLTWMKKHDIHTYRTPDAAGCPLPWSAWAGDLTESVNAGGGDPSIGGYAYGDTEDEAIYALANGRGWRLWNEECAL